MNDFDSIIKRITVTRLEPGDYTGEDGLLYCGKCRTPKQFRMEAPPLEGRLLPHPCRCEQERLDREAAEQEARRHRQAVDDLKHRGFTDPVMRGWTFANDNGKHRLTMVNTPLNRALGVRNQIFHSNDTRSAVAWTWERMMSATCRRSSKSMLSQLPRWEDRYSIFCGETLSAFSAAISFISP